MMFEFLSGWEFWVGGFLGFALTGWPIWKTAYSWGWTDALDNMEFWDDGKWTKAVDPESRKGN
jgi:hypothetical protein